MDWNNRISVGLWAIKGPDFQQAVVFFKVEYHNSMTDINSFEPWMVYQGL